MDTYRSDLFWGKSEIGHGGTVRNRDRIRTMIRTRVLMLIRNVLTPTLSTTAVASITCTAVPRYGRTRALEYRTTGYRSTAVHTHTTAVIPVDLPVLEYCSTHKSNKAIFECSTVDQLCARALSSTEIQ